MHSSEAFAAFAAPTAVPSPFLVARSRPTASCTRPAAAGSSRARSRLDQALSDLNCLANELHSRAVFAAFVLGPRLDQR
jgi:hypothetical protein